MSGWQAKNLSPNTRAGYEQVSREFLEYLGEAGAHRRLESITQADIRGFIRCLRESGRSPAESGRSPATIKKLVRKYLSRRVLSGSTARTDPV